MPDYFRGGATPRLRVNFLSILLIGAIYFLPRYIASSPQGVCRSKTRDAPKGKHKTADPSSPWDLGWFAKSAWGSTPSSAEYFGTQKACAKSSRLRLGAANQPEDRNLLESYIALKFSALDCQCSSPRELGWEKRPTLGSYLLGNKFNCHVCFDNTEVEFSRKDAEL